jgi:hypothetical protein
MVVDPTWAFTNNMQGQHYFHTATKLQDGRVLVAGGKLDSCGCTTSLAEIYNPATMTWTKTRTPMGQARELHTATLLKNGEVLVAGAGYTSNPTTAEIYNPTSDTWCYTGSMYMPHIQGSMVLLPDGRLMIYGGTNSVGQSDPTTEIHNPATGVLTLTASPLVKDESNMVGSTITLLSNGKSYIQGPFIPITFKDGTTVLGTVPLLDQGATFDLSNLTRGTHSITATYNGSSLYRSSTSPVFTLTVKPVTPPLIYPHCLAAAQ